MSRRVHQPAVVETDEETGTPVRVDGAAVRSVLHHFREWIGILQGEPERDIWRLELPRGICEVHLIRTGQPGQPGQTEQTEQTGHWLLARWED